MNTWKARGISMLLTGSMLMSVMGVSALAADGKTPAAKEETVFVVAGADGKAREIIVSDWLQNGSGADRLKDSSNLKDIQVVKGDAEMEGSGSGLSWQADGEDVYYQGTSTEKLPVGVEFSYELNGKKITPEELAGQSGTLKIIIQYQNNTKETVTVDGKQETMTVPFLMITGLLLDSENCRNVTVDHGTVETDGDRTIILGYGLPGLADSLKLQELAGEDAEAPELPERVEITADVTDFDLEMAVTVASCGLLNKLELSGNETREELEDALEELEDATQKLMDGTEDLLDGTKSLKDGTEELLDGAGTLKDGTVSLKDGTASLKSGTSSLKSGTGELLSGAASLDDGAGELQSGGRTLQTGAASLDEGAGSLREGVGSLKSGITQIQQALSALDAQSSTLTEGSAAVKQALLQIQGALQGVSMSTDALDTLTAGSGEIQKGLTTLRESTAALQQGVSYGAYQQLLMQQGIDLDALQAGNSAAIKGLDQVLTVLDGQIQALEAAASAKTQGDTQETKAAGNGNAKAKNVPQASEAVTGETGEIPEEAAVWEDTAAEDMEAASEGEASETEEAVPETALTEPEAVSEAPAESDMENMPEAEATGSTAAEYRLQMLDDGQSALSQLKAVREQLGQLRVLLGTNNQAIAGTNAVAEAYLTGVNYNLVRLLEGVETLETEYGKLHSGILTLAGTLTGLSESMGQLSAGIDELVTQYTALDNGTQAYTGAVGEILAGQQKLTAGADTLAQGTDTLKAGTEQLYTGAGTLVAGLDTLHQGTGSLQSGAKQLDSGAGELDSGAGELDSGAGELNSGAGELLDGVKKLDDGAGELHDGAEELRDGMQEYQEDGIGKLLDLYQDHIPVLLDRLEALQKLGQDYNSYSGVTEGTDGSVRFIIRTEN